jgi:L-ascorbate metabolism protein UlaG (beta-lactamase superfamily)
MALSITWLGHSTWLIKNSKYQILIDPFLTDNPVAKVKPEEVSAQIILISHGHFDHVQDAAAIANRCKSTLVANYEIATWFSEKHQVGQTIGMNIGGATKLPFGQVFMTPALHSSQLPDGSYGGNPGGFLFEIDNVRIFYTGDTGLFSDLALWSKPTIDLLILPIGDLFTMGIEESIRAIELIQPKYVLPTHYNTWPPIKQNAFRWAELVQQRTSSKAIVLSPSEEYVYPPKG